MTCFRVRDWVTHVIRGASWEFHQRRVFHDHSRPATQRDRCDLFFPSTRGYFGGILAVEMVGEFILRFDPELQDIIQVAKVGFITFPFGKWVGIPNLWTLTQTPWRLSCNPTSLRLSLIFASALSYLCPFFVIKFILSLAT